MSQPKPALQRNALSLASGIALAAAAMAPSLAVVLNAPAAAPSAGSFYAYNSHGLGKAGGFFTGWMFCLGYAILAPGLFAALGDFSQSYLRQIFQVDVPCWTFSLAGMALVTGLSLRSIAASTR